MMLHGAGICTPTFAQTKSPSHVGFYIPAPWVAYGICCFSHSQNIPRVFTAIFQWQFQEPKLEVPAIYI